MNRSPLFIIWWKEFRAVLPLWAAVAVTLVVPSIVGDRILGPEPHAWRLAVLAMGSVAVAAWLFTREFQDRTLIWQLLLPQSRATSLFRKIVVAAALQLLLSALYLMGGAAGWGRSEVFLDLCLVVTVVAPASACFWASVQRSVPGVLVLALATPFLFALSCYGIIEALAERSRGEWFMALGVEETRNQMIEALFGLYAIGCAAGVAVFWRRLQIKGDAVHISTFETTLSMRWLSARVYIRRPAWLALARKELGLQRFCSWLAALFAIAAIGFTIGDLSLQHLINVATQDGQDTLRLDWWQSMLRSFGSAMFVVFATLIPALTGALAFAEEEHLGNRAWQLCQPVKAGWLWFVKLGVATGLSLGLGIVLPVFVAWAYGSFSIGEAIIPGVEPGVPPQLLITHFLLFSLSAWCATWSRNTVTAIMKAFLGLLSFVAFQQWMYGLLFVGRAVHSLPDWRFAALAVVVAALTMTLPNHRRLDIGVRHWLGQTALLTGLVAIGVFLGATWP